ncbi:MAG: beta-lactamase family protein [Kosmotoga sp.]|nr:MAG: beta-lactamase family protein [Kosmotoga sp.]
MNLWKKIDSLIETGIKRKIYPGATLLIGKENKIIYSNKYGKLSKDINSTDVTSKTVYDIASLTKVVTVVPSIMKLLSDGIISLEDPVYLYLDEFQDRKDILILHLLSHSSGLPAYSELWKEKTGNDLLKGILKVQPETKPFDRFEYSCLNYVILRAMVERITSIDFDKYCREEIFEPLDMAHTTFNPDPSVEYIAPTSIRNGETLKGKPDDELAYYLGGIGGNAGSFSNVHDLFNYLVGLKEGKLFPQKIFNEFTSRVIAIKDVKTHIGWRSPETGKSAGDFLNTRAYGHTGFTGTSIWVDPESDISVILLSNRTNIERWETIPKMQSIRRRLHNLVFAYMN